MTAQTIERVAETGALQPYTVDGGSLVMSPAPAPVHQIVAAELRTLLSPLAKPHGARAVSAVAIGVTDEDGPVPDVTVADAVQLRGLTGAVPLDAAHTVVEIVSLDPADLDTL